MCTKNLLVMKNKSEVEMKWLRAKSMANLWVVDGWKLACEKHKILSNNFLSNKFYLCKMNFFL